VTVQIYKWVMRRLLAWGVPRDDVEVVAALTILFHVVLLAWLAQRVSKHFISGSVRALARRTPGRWDDLLAERRVFEPTSHLGSGIVLFTLLPIAFVEVDDAKDVIRRGALVYMVLVTSVVVDRMLTALVDLYQEFDVKRSRPPLKSYAQVLKIVNFIVVGILLLSVVLGQSPAVLLGGLGALSAVLLLIFRDPLLGLVASVQLNANDMIRRGDPIEVPKHGVDGEVVDMSLTTVKVLSADRSIATVPNYTLVSDSFRNLRNIREAGMRRLKRALHVDMHSVRFVGAGELDALGRNAAVAAVLPDLRERFEAGVATNLGIFRRYIERYAARQATIDPAMPVFARQLAPGENGVGIELNGYIRETDYARFEALQAELFEHLIAVACVFGLRLFQNPSSGGEAPRLSASAAPDEPSE
jgi:miniconductance mechanosensitive channel